MVIITALAPPQPPVSRPAPLPWIIKCKRVRVTPPQPPVSRPDSEPWICYKYSSTPHVRTGVLPNLVEKQSLKKEVATQTEEHLPPFELAPSSTWQIVETCIGESMFGPRGYSLLPPELFQEIEQHIQELKKCRFLLMSRCYKTVEIVSRGGSRGRVQGVHTRDDLGFSNTTGILPKKKTMWFIGVEEEQETSAPPPKKNPESTPGI